MTFDNTRRHKTELQEVDSHTQNADKMVADLTYQWYDSEPQVDTVGIYVENHHGSCRDLFIWE